MVTSSQIKLEAKDVLPNINRTQAADRAENAVFCPCWPWPVTLTFKLVRARDQARLLCEFGANPFSGFRDISYTKKKHRLTAPKTQPSAVHCRSLRTITRRWWLGLVVTAFVIVTKLLDVELGEFSDGWPLRPLQPPTPSTLWNEYRSRAVSVLWGWEGNRRSDVTPATYQTLCGIFAYGFNGLRTGDEHPQLRHPLPMLHAKLEALGQCKPPPRQVLSVPPSDESVWMNVC